MNDSRDVRLTDDQLAVSIVALRDEIKKRTRSIEKAAATKAAGGTIQHGVLDEHYARRDAARSALEVFEVARAAIKRQKSSAIRAALGLEEVRS